MRFSDKQDLTQPQKLEQVWFPGMHTDVGGQEVAKYSRNIISYHSFRWMMSKASDLGLVFKKDLLRQISDSSSCKYIFQDSYCSAIIYRIMPRVDRVIEKDINTQSYNPAVQLYNGGDFSSFMTQKDMDRYKSKALIMFYKNAADRKLD